MEGGEKIGNSHIAPKRVARPAAQALPQEGRQKRDFEHSPPKTLVCI